MVKIDPRGVSQTPGVRGVPGQETKDIVDAVEWTAIQPWCTGMVALAGNSYGANVQWPVAIMKPKGLKAFVPYAGRLLARFLQLIKNMSDHRAGDIDRYREVSYIGGVPVHNYISQWFRGVRAASPRWKDAGDVMPVLRSMPFYSSAWKKAEIEMEKIDLPCFLAASQLLIVHNRGSYEAWRRLATKDKHLQIVDSNYYGWPNHQVVEKIAAFLDRHLKGSKAAELEPVGLEMRIGGGLWYWRTEEDWPVPGTQYIKWYLNTDGVLARFYAGGPERQLSYSAVAEPTESAGVSFISAPFTEDTELAGHFTATLHVSSSIHDADVVVQLWAVDSNDNVVHFCTSNHPEPMAFGILRASHRKTDHGKSLPWRPWHTHTEEDYASLRPGEVVKLEVEIFPATARIRSGWKLRVDITPSEEQPNIPGFKPPKMREWQKEIHPEGATNTVHVGGDYTSFITLPVIPLKSIGKIGAVSRYEQRSDKPNNVGAQRGQAIGVPDLHECKDKR
jgi:predicted acyl esterase